MVIRIGSEGSKSYELVVGLVAPIGVKLDDVQKAITDSFKRHHYNGEIIHITKIMIPYIKTFTQNSTSNNISEGKINDANELCRVFQDNAFLSYLAVGEISDRRESTGNSSSTDENSSRVIYIIRQLKRREEIDVLRSVYGERFILVSATDNEANRKARVRTHKLGGGCAACMVQAP